MKIGIKVILTCVAAFTLLAVVSCSEDDAGDRQTNPNIGTARIIWTLINSQVNPGVDTPADCPLLGNVAVTFTGPTSGSSSGPCLGVPLVIPNLEAGSYTFDLVLSDETNHPGQSAAAQVSADIIAGNIADIPVTIDCTFCSAQ